MRTVRFLALASCLFAPLAFAAGFAYPDNGVEAMGRAGAFTAKADDGTAIYYNPAGLAEQDGLRITVDANFVNNAITFQRTDPVTGAPIGPAVSNAAPMFVAPFVAVSYQIVKHLTVAIGVYGPPADGQLNFPGESIPKYDASNPNGCAGNCSVFPGSNGYPAPEGPGSAPQKYGLISDNIFVAYPSLSLAWSPIPQLSLGATGQMVYATTTLQQAAFDGALFEGGQHDVHNESAAWDTLANVTVPNNIGERFAGIFGVAVRPFAGLRFGASYRPWIPIDETGSLQLQYSTLAQSLGAQIKGQNTTQAADNTSGTGPADFYLQMPGELKTGVGWAFGGGSDIELDFNYTQWSQVKQLALVPNFSVAAAGSTTPIPSAAIPEHFNDTWALRLGGDYEIPIPLPFRLTVRAGLSYETSVYDGQGGSNCDAATGTGCSYPSLTYANFDMYSFAAGVSAGWKWIELALGYTHVYEPTQTVKNGGGTMLMNNAPPGTAPVGIDNGIYTTSYDVLAVGVKLRFL